MNYKFKISLLAAILYLTAPAFPAFAQTIPINFVNAFKVTVNGVNLTIAAGSTATSVKVGAAANPTLTAIVPAGKTFTLVSADRFSLANNLSLLQSCVSSENAVTATGPVTVVFSPTAAICSPPGVGGVGGGGGTSGGGGGGGSSGDTNTPGNISINISGGAASTSSLPVNLSLSSTNAVQMMLSNDPGFAGALWESYLTNRSWILGAGDGVKTVYVRFRDASGNISGTVSDIITLTGSATGTTNVPQFPNTGNITAIRIPGCVGTAGASPITGQSCANNLVLNATIYDFGVVTLRNGSRGAAVMELQRFLNRYLNLGLTVDGKLGPKTIAEVKKWQMDNGLLPDGQIGVKTKAKMNAMAATN